MSARVCLFLRPIVTEARLLAGTWEGSYMAEEGAARGG